MIPDDELRKIAKMAVAETLLSLGLDMDDPLEAQKDFQHLRAWRESVETVKRQGLVTAVGAVATGIIALIWVALHKAP